MSKKLYRHIKVIIRYNKCIYLNIFSILRIYPFLG